MKPILVDGQRAEIDRGQESLPDHLVLTLAKARLFSIVSEVLGLGVVQPSWLSSLRLPLFLSSRQYLMMVNAI